MPIPLPASPFYEWPALTRRAFRYVLFIGRIQRHHAAAVDGRAAPPRRQLRRGLSAAAPAAGIATRAIMRVIARRRPARSGGTVLPGAASTEKIFISAIFSVDARAGRGYILAIGTGWPDRKDRRDGNDRI